MADSQINLEGIKKLIEKYHDSDLDMAEANVAELFVAPLFNALGWDTGDLLTWNRQQFIRNAGYADAAILIENDPVLFVEMKRFGGVARPQEDVNNHQALYGDEPILSHAERRKQGIDRTPEEKQAMRYARGAGIPWAVLTNFERLILFDANEERVVLAFDKPEEYLERVDDLKHLRPANTREEFNSRLQWFADIQKKPDVDEDFYAFLSNWRLRLAQAIYDHNQGTDSALLDTDGNLSLDLLRQAVQRTLDRLIIIRYADDVGFLRQHDLLENTLSGFQGRLAYVLEYELQQDINRLYRNFYRVHDTTIFVPDHICERVQIDNQTLMDLVREISAISFRKFTSDILGNTYESYLGQTLVLEGDTLQAESDRSLRKESGIYYTPSYIVRYIVDHTLGRWLYGTEDGKPDGEPLSDAAPKTVNDLDGLRILDPAMGSGSFLIYAFEVLANFYERENARIEEHNANLWGEWGKQAMKEGMFGENNDAPKITEEQIPDYINRILQEHLYGVDLDPEAVEIASVNLILRAFDRLKGKREHHKLPLLLRQNFKVGNSLISGVTEREDLNPFAEERRQLIALREELKSTGEDQVRAEKLAEIDSVAEPVNTALNASLEEHFEDVESKHPFDWEIEFPEVFNPDTAEEEQGFTIVIGNPPYIGFQGFKTDKEYLRHVYESAYGRFDVYIPFIERGINVLSNNGFLSYICPTNFMKRGHGKPIRKILQNDVSILEIVDFGHKQIFEDALNYTGVFKFKKTQPSLEHTIAYKQGIDENGFSYPQNTLDEKCWIFRKRAHRQIVQKMQAQPITILQDLTLGISEGIVTGKNEVFLLTKSQVAQHNIEEGILKKCLRGEDVRAWFTDWSGHYLIYPYKEDNGKVLTISTNELKTKYPNTWAYLSKQRNSLAGRAYFEKSGKKWYELWNQRDLTQQKSPKIVVPELADKNRFSSTSPKYFYVDTICGLVLNNNSQNNILYTLSLLNSSLTEYFYKQTTVPKAGEFFIYKTMFLNHIPIRSINLANSSEKAQYDALIKLAQRMLDINQTRQAVTDAFSEVIRAYERESSTLHHFLNEQNQYITRRAIMDANDEGEVNAIQIEERENNLIIEVKIEEIWQDMIRLEIEDENLRLYLLLSIRAFLEDNSRKRIWSRGKIIGGVLQELQVPRLASATPKAHQKRVTNLMDDVRNHLPGDLPHHNTGLDRKDAPLHLSLIETDLDKTDAEIDQRVYELYDLTEEEIAIVESIV